MPFRSLWLLVGPALAIVGFASGEPIITGVGLIVVLVGAGSRFWANHLFDRVSLRISLSEDHVFLDESLTLTVELENRKILPLPWFEWRVAVAEVLKADGEQLASSSSPGWSWIWRRGASGWYETQKWNFTVRADERGYHNVGPVTVASGDLLGLFPRQIELSDLQAIIAYPRVYDLTEMGFPADRPLGDNRGRNRIFEDPLRISGLRDHHPSDPLRRIDWKATARRGELQSKVYEPSAIPHLYLFMNIDTLGHSWEGYLKDDLERTISVTASVVVWASGRRFAVGLLANGSFPNADRPIRIVPSRSRDQLTRLLETLAVVQPLTMGNLAGAIQRELARIPAGSTIVLVAAFLTEELGAAIARLKAEGHEVVAILTTESADARLLGDVECRVVARDIEAAEVLR